MNQSGITTNGQPVIAGGFTPIGTHGVPLELVLAYFQQRGWVMDWPDYIDAALKDGHNPRTVKGRILAAVGDVYGREHAHAVGERVDRYFSKQAG